MKHGTILASLPGQSRYHTDFAPPVLESGWQNDIFPCEMKDTAYDPIKFEVIRNALVETTEEMSAALRRSAYSTNIKTRCDYSCAIFDREMRVLAQCFAQANHLGSMVRMVPLAVRDYGAGEPYGAVRPAWPERGPGRTR